MESDASSDHGVEQSTLNGNSMKVPNPDCRLHGGICGNSAKYIADLSGNKYADGGEVLVCESCLEELKEGNIKHREISEQELVRRTN